MTSGLENLEHTVQLTHVWINELDDRLGWNNKPRSYRLLKAVLHALRDWLPLNEMADLAAQLPTLLRGAYYEQWRPAHTPVKHRTKADFLARVEDLFKADPLAETSRDVIAVLELLSKKRFLFNVWIWLWKNIRTFKNRIPIHTLSDELATNSIAKWF